MDDLVSLIEYLDSIELQTLQADLSRAGINCVVNNHGPRSGKTRSFYYEIRVSYEQYSRAARIVEEFKASQSKKSQRCPKCKALAPEPLEKLTFFQRIYYMGTTPVRCQECKTVYVT
jgi:hypothetical protein